MVLVHSINRSLIYGLLHAAAAVAKSLQSCPTLCDPRDGSPPGSPIPGILQARTLEWVAISFSNTWKWKVKVKSLIHVRLLVTPWTVYQATRPAYQAPPSMGFSRQEYWRGVPSPSPIWPWVGLLIHEFGLQKIALFPWNYPWLVHKVNMNLISQGECQQSPLTGMSRGRNDWVQQSRSNLFPHNLSRNGLHLPGSRAESKKNKSVWLNQWSRTKFSWSVL